MDNKTIDKIFRILNNILMFILLVVFAYPFFYILIYSLSDPTLASTGVLIFPKSFTFINYTKIFNQNLLLNSIFISASRAVIGTLITLICCTLFSYLVTKEQLPCRKAIYRFVIITMYFSPGIIPWYITMLRLGLKNNFLLYILPTAIGAFYVIIIKTYIESLPPALEESAFIDGAGIFATFTKIILPLSIPIIAAVAVFSIVVQWNTWFDNYLLVSNTHLKTLQLTLYDYFNRQMAEVMAMARGMSSGVDVKITPMSIRMSITMISVFPIFLAYPLLRKYFLKGLILGAIKG